MTEPTKWIDNPRIRNYASIVGVLVMIALLVYLVMNVEAVKSNPCGACEQMGYTCENIKGYLQAVG